jgi:hypothetical protein
MVSRSRSNVIHHISPMAAKVYQYVKQALPLTDADFVTGISVVSMDALQRQNYSAACGTPGEIKELQNAILVPLSVVHLLHEQLLQVRLYWATMQRDECIDERHWRGER